MWMVTTPLLSFQITPRASVGFDPQPDGIGGFWP